MTELAISQQSTEVFLPTSLEESSITEEELSGKHRQPYLKNILALAAVGVVAFNGAYAVDLPKSSDATQAVVTSTAVDNTIAGSLIDIPATSPVNLFGDLTQDAALDSYYKKANFFELSDLT